MRKLACTAAVAAAGVALALGPLPSGGAAGRATPSGYAERVFPGQPPAPRIALRTLRGERVSLQAFRGRPTLVAFWAEWCRPCTRANMEVVERWAARAQRRGGTVVSVAAASEIERVRAFARRRRLRMPILLDPKPRLLAMFPKVGSSRGLPTAYVLDPAGRIRAGQTTPLTDDFLRRHFEPLLER